MRISLFLSALCVAGCLAAPARAESQTLIYDLYAGGFHALEAKAVLEESKDRYAMTLTSGTTKTFKLVAPWSGTFKVAGWKRGEKRQPETYNVFSKITDKLKTKDYRYASSGKLLSFKATENGKDKTPEKIEPELTPPGITDVLTTTLLARDRVNKTGSCDGSSLIFDGDRSFTLTFKSTGDEVLPVSDYNIFNGQAIGCTFEMTPEKGKWKKKLRGWLMLQEQGRKLDSMPTVWFAKIPGGDGTYVPVKLQVKTNYGTLILHLRSAAGTDGKIFTAAAKKAP